MNHKNDDDDCKGGRKMASSRRRNSTEVPQVSSELGYQHTLMYGRYTALGDYAREEAARQRSLDKRRWKDTGFKPYRGKCQSKCINALSVVWRHTFARVGEEWVFLALLGMSMALISFAMDYGIAMCLRARLWLYRDIGENMALQYIAWVSFPLVLILFSSGFTHIVAPQAIGSGIPELKTILRGVVLKEYLTLRTLISKIVGLTTSLGSGMPLGKVGPFVHISSVMAALMSKIFTSLGGVVYENEGRNHELLAAACAVGVACCFAAPVGGVLFSIEATTAYFAVRNYWRGFFAAVFGALVFRLLAVWFTDEETLTSLFRTNFRLEVPFDLQELFAFVVLGVLCGLLGAAFVLLHRKYVLWMRKNKKISFFLQKNRFIYPTIITATIASLTFPPGLGKYMAAELGTQQHINQLFSNFTWSVGVHTPEQQAIIDNWTTPNANTFICLTVYILSTFWCSLLGCTLPVAAGLFIPLFKMGAGLGRLIGELMAYTFPEGISFGSRVYPILPGGYAVAGAAAWSGATTHTISTALIVFELTGQINYFVPVMVSVLVGNAVHAALQPSVYDSIIRIKKLPYLPEILSRSAKVYNIYVEDIMMRDVKYICVGSTYREVKDLLESARKIKTYPLVDSKDSRILIGSVQRSEMIILLARHLGRDRRLHMAAKRAMQESSERSREEALEAIAVPTAERRPSRFEVTPAPDTLQQPNAEDSASIEMAEEPEKQPRPTPIAPKKSILKKSYSMGYFSPATTPVATPYSTVTSQDTRLRMAFEAIFRKSQALRGLDKNEPGSAQSTITSAKKVQLPRERVIDMSPEEQKAWEEEQLDMMVNFNKCQIDPAPFQLVERTSVLKVHSLFSMLGLSHAYVTAIGRLVGVVALKEIRSAIEGNLHNQASVPKLADASANRDINVPIDISDAHYLSTVSSINSESGIMTTDSDNEDAAAGANNVSKL